MSAKEFEKKFIVSTTFLLLLLIPLTVILSLKSQKPLINQQVSAAGLPSLPNRWPTTLQLGLNDGPGGAAAMKQVTNYGFRYQYLAGGVNTGNGWANWNANGDFVRFYIQDSIANNIIPVFTYYMMYQSIPGNSMSEYDGIYANLQNTSTMTSYFNDLKLFYQKAGAFSDKLVVLHVDPDVWGYMQQRSSGDNATTVPAKVAATGLTDLQGLPDNISGFAKAVVKLRDLYAPNVVLGYHLSIWGTGIDIIYSDPSDSQVDSLSTRSGNFYNSLQANFDVSFGEFTDRDAAFKQYVYGDGGGSWYNSSDYARNLRYITKFVSVTQKRFVIWQIPFGNTKMRAMNNTWNHYQSNQVEWLLDDPTRAHLQDYVNAGVIAFMFGRGADGATCACDANNDGITNPAAINGNNLLSLNADDDGGFFKDKAKVYYNQGPMNLSSGSKIGDINGDGSVGILDLSVLLSTWGSTTDLRADLNGNGQIDLIDLSTLLSNWGT